MSQENDPHDDEIGDAIIRYQDLLYSEDPDSQKLAELHQLMWETIDQGVEDGLVVGLSYEEDSQTLDQSSLLSRARKLLPWNR